MGHPGNRRRNRPVSAGLGGDAQTRLQVLRGGPGREERPPAAAGKPGCMTAGPFAHYAATYRAHGFSPIPVRPGSKAPLISDWSRWCRELPPPDLVQEWVRRYPGSGIAIATGPASGLLALDLDYCTDGLLT